MDDLDDLDVTSGIMTDHDDDLNTTDQEAEESITALSAGKNRLSPLKPTSGTQSRSPSPQPSYLDDSGVHLDEPFDTMLMSAPSVTSPANSIRSAGDDVFCHFVILLFLFFPSSCNLHRFTIYNKQQPPMYQLPFHKAPKTVLVSMTHSIMT